MVWAKVDPISDNVAANALSALTPMLVSCPRKGPPPNPKNAENEEWLPDFGGVRANFWELVVRYGGGLGTGNKHSPEKTAIPRFPTCRT
jgi:hypothetical protein